MILAPVVITGLFGIAPKLYDEITEPKNKLNYFIQKSPVIEDSGKYKSILSINIINNGQTVLNNLIGNIIIDDGIFEKVAFEDKNFVNPKYEFVDSSFVIKCDKLMPKDNFIISMLVSSDKNNLEMNINIRTDELRASELEILKKEKDGLDSVVLGAISSSLIVLTMILLLLNNKFRDSLSNYILVFSYKKSMIFYLGIKSKNEYIINTFNNSKEITYLNSSDIIYSQYLLTNDGNLKLAQAGLLFIKLIENTSRNIVINNLRKMSNLELSVEQLKILEKYRTNDILVFRKLIDDIYVNGFDKYISLPK
jgi:hypothetical protein